MLGTMTLRVRSSLWSSKWVRITLYHNVSSSNNVSSSCIVLAAFFCTIAFAYYKQLLNPTFGRSQARAPSQQFDNANATFPAHYNPPYLAYNAPPQGGFAPPPGPPPAGGYDASKPPTYEGPGIPGYGENKDNKDDPFADFETVKKGDSRDALV